MSPTRRQILLASSSGFAAFAGCSASSDPQQSLLIAVNNYTESRHQIDVLIERDGTELVRQYLEVAAGEPNAWPTIETKVALGEMPEDTGLNVTVKMGDGSIAHTSVSLDCTHQYTGNAVYAEIEKPGTLGVNELCYDEFPSSDGVGGWTNHS
jgi:hypothetical protein